MLVHLWSWFQEVLGLNFGLPGHTLRWYNFHSGSGSIILPPIFTLAGAYAMYRYHNMCHWPGCIKVGKHPFHHYKLCPKHHPDVPHKAQVAVHITKLHKEADK